MQKRTALILVGSILAAGVSLVLVALFIVPLIRSQSGPVPVPVDLPAEHSLTPSEVSLEVTPRRDGTLEVRQRLIIDVPSGGDPALRWRIDSTTLGRDPAIEHRRFAMMPEILELRAVELSTAEDSTQDSPAEEGRLTFETETLNIDGFDEDGVRIEFRLPDGQPRWSAGRHVIDFTYVLDRVFVAVAGHERFILPLRFPSSILSTETFTTMTVSGHGQVSCLNVSGSLDFDEDCRRVAQKSTGDETTELRWTQDEARGRLAAVAVEPPQNMSVQPVRAQELRR